MLSRITTLRGDESCPGYDELTACYAQSVFCKGDHERIEQIGTYVGSHTNRARVLNAAERELVNA